MTDDDDPFAPSDDSGPHGIRQQKSLDESMDLLTKAKRGRPRKLDPDTALRMIEEVRGTRTPKAEIANRFGISRPTLESYLDQEGSIRAHLETIKPPAARTDEGADTKAEASERLTDLDPPARAGATVTDNPRVGCGDPAKICAENGCLVIVMPLKIDLMTQVVRSLPSALIVDGVLSELARCMVAGSKQQLADARRAIAAYGYLQPCSTQSGPDGREAGDHG